MFVSDALVPSAVKLRILSPEGALWLITANPGFTIETLKAMALGHFYNPVEVVQPKMMAQYKLISVPQKRTLKEVNSVLQEALRENDELLLLRINKSAANESEPEAQEDQCKGPSQADILEHTSHLPTAKHKQETDSEEIHKSIDFQNELRKIIVTLADASMKILKYNSSAWTLIVGEPNAPESSTSQPRNLHQPPLSAINKLVDMGFPQNKVVEALKLNNMSYDEAMEWLLEQKYDDDDAMEIASTPNSYPTLPAHSSSSQCSSQASFEVPCDNVPELMDAFRAHRRREFRPNFKALNSLKEMGFDEKEALDALRIAVNNQEAACEWLLRDNKPTQEDLEKGLDPESAVYGAIMNNATIQLGLTNPKTLIAFLHMLENLGSLSNWLADPDTTPLLTQVFRIYHSEKHTSKQSPPTANFLPASTSNS